MASWSASSGQKSCKAAFSDVCRRYFRARDKSNDGLRQSKLPDRLFQPF
jgi:hypothetical protein